MGIKNKCIHSVNDAWCNNDNIKKSLFGIGARCCVDYGKMSNDCKYYTFKPKPSIKIKGTERSI